MENKRQVHFTMETEWLVWTLLKFHCDSNYDRNDDYPKAVRYALSEILYTNPLTAEELDYIMTQYSENDVEEEEVTVTGEEEQVKEMFKYLFDLERYKKVYWENILKGLGPYEYSVIDKLQKVEYQCNYTEHFETITKIIKDNYLETFNSFSQKEKDAFILDNFTLIGKTNNMDWYLKDVDKYVE